MATNQERTSPSNDRLRSPLTDRIPPQNLDAEMALLGSMMMSREAIAEVIPVIKREDSRWFYRPDHQKLFEVLLDLYDDASKAIDLLVVTDELERRNLIDEIGGQDYMIELAESFGEWANAEHYAKLVRDKGLLRDLIRTTSEIIEDAYTGVDETREILDAAEQRIFAVTEQRVSGQAKPLSEAVERMANIIETRGADAKDAVPTGFGMLDNVLGGGFHHGELIVLAGRPAMGKTALGLTMAMHAAQHENRPALFFSMEMSADALAQRLVCAQTGVDSQKIRRRSFSKAEQQQLLMEGCAVLAKTPFYVDDTPSQTPMAVRSTTRRTVQRDGIEIVYLDYLQLMTSPRAESRQVEIATISRHLKSLARELNIPVIAMAQLNRLPDGRTDKRPFMSDLRESGAIEQDADVILLIHRPEYYEPHNEELNGIAEIIVAKQRNGPTDTIKVHFDKSLTRFAPLHVGPEPAEAYATPATENVPF